MRIVVVLSSLLLVARVGAADPPAPPAPPPRAAGDPRPAAPPASPGDAATAVVSAVRAGDTVALHALAAVDDPDPWLVADELLRRDEPGAAAAFAAAAPRVDVDRLPAYVASRRGVPDDAARRERFARANAALKENPQAALDVLGAPEPDEIVDVVGVRREMARGLALGDLGRSREAADAHARAGAAAERLGWVARAFRAWHHAGDDARNAADLRAAREAWERCLAICERRGDRTWAARTLGNLGIVLRDLGEPTAARSAYERALTAQEAEGDRVGAAATLLNLGNLLADVGDAARALSAYERAVVLDEALGEGAAAARARRGIGRAHVALGNYPEALAALSRARADQVSMGDAAAAASTLGEIGTVHAALGDLAAARSAYERALEALEAAGGRAGVGTVLSNLAGAHVATGDYALALATYRRALEVQESGGDAAGAARTLGSIGVVQDTLGDPARALTTLERALAAQERLGDRRAAAQTLANIGSVQYDLRDLARALATFERALAVQEALGDRAGAASTLGSIAAVQYARDDLAGALVTYERVLAAQETLGDAVGAARTRDAIGSVYAGLGDAARSLAVHEQALAAQERLGDRLGAARTLGNVATAHHDLGHYAEAVATHERALAARESLGDDAGVAHTLTNLGLSWLALGDRARAMALERRAIEVAGSLARGLGAEEAVGARARTSRAYDIGAAAAIAAKDPAELAYFLESSRAGALLEGLQAREALLSAVLPPDLRREEAEARVAHAAARTALRRAVDGGDRSEIATRRSALAAAAERVSSVVARIQREARAGADVVCPPVASLDQIRTSLAEGDTLVLFAVLEKGAAALVVTREGARIAWLGPSATLRADIDALALHDPSVVAADALARLAERVVKPLALGPTTKRLLVSPSGPLYGVPFAALVPDVAVAYLPSGTTYRWLLEDVAKRGDGVLALGDPDYATHVEGPASTVRRGPAGGLVRLPATRDEARAVGTVTLLSSEATERGLREALRTRPRWRALHLACHGLLDAERPALSSLALTAADDDDGFLTCLEVFRTRIPADLVVLSACETARGRVVGGEGLDGFPRAFMFAGTPRVICSLWKVDDEATRTLMTTFYGLWAPRDGTPGLATAEALRRAQEAVRSDERWKHPYYWAAWVLWGLPS